MQVTTDQHEFELQLTLDNLADKVVSPLCARVAPEAYQNMVCLEADASDCHLGHLPGKPFSGVISVCDFCAHSHKDINTVRGECTVVLTLTKPENRVLRKILDDEQLHVLPFYSLEHNDIRGVAISLCHGSILFECANMEMHATTALKTPNISKPSRIGVVFYQHKNTIFPQLVSLRLYY